MLVYQVQFQGNSSSTSTVEVLFENLTLSPVLYIALSTLNARFTQRLHHFTYRPIKGGRDSSVVAMWRGCARLAPPAGACRLSRVNRPPGPVGPIASKPLLFLFFTGLQSVYLLCGGWMLIHIACGALAQTVMWMLTRQTGLIASWWLALIAHCRTVSLGSFSICAPKVERS